MNIEETVNKEAHFVFLLESLYFVAYGSLSQLFVTIGYTTSFCIRHNLMHLNRFATYILSSPHNVVGIIHAHISTVHL